MYSEPMKTLRVLVICESGMFIALAFSRSMVTSTCGSFAEKEVVKAVEIITGVRLAPTI